MVAQASKVEIGGIAFEARLGKKLGRPYLNK
jgi:hypothetical protein